MDAKILIGLAHFGVFGLLVAAIDDGRRTMGRGQASQINRTIWGLFILTLLSAFFWFLPFQCLVPPGKAPDEFASVHLTKLLGTSGQATLLSVLIALAAYTSTVLRNLRDAEKRAPDQKHWRNISNDKEWLRAVDVWLVLTGASMALRTGALAGGYWWAEWDRQVLAFTGAIIVYFALLHFRQWHKDDWICSPVYDEEKAPKKAPLKCTLVDAHGKELSIAPVAAIPQQTQPSANSG